jgi:hypothetical protein
MEAVPTPYIGVILMLEPTGNCVCGSKEPVTLFAGVREVVAKNPAMPSISRIAPREYFTILFISFHLRATIFNRY